MKFLEFIQSIFVPRYMVIHRKMKLIFAFLILIAVSFIMSLPSIIYLPKMKYNELQTRLSYDILKYVDDNNPSLDNEFTEDELSKFNMVRFSDLKNLKIVIDHADGIQNTNNGLVDSKDYVLKAVKPIYDDEGTYIIKYEISYVHIVFDISAENDDKTYDVAEVFNKLANVEEGRFGHYLLLFDEKSLTFKNSSTNYILANLPYYNKVVFNFSNMENATELANLISDTYAPSLRNTYMMRSLFYVGLITLAMAILFSFILRETGQLRGVKEYINFASIASIPLTIFAFAFSFIKYTFCALLLQWYPAIFGIYYFILVIIINRRPRLDKNKEVV